MGGSLLLMAVLKSLGSAVCRASCARRRPVHGELLDDFRKPARRGASSMLITLVFGLIHGFGFAADLLELQLPPNGWRTAGWL